jgi:hypothetical protein
MRSFFSNEYNSQQAEAVSPAGPRDAIKKGYEGILRDTEGNTHE